VHISASIMRNAGNARRVTRARGVIPGQPPGPAVVHCRYAQKAPSPMVADPMDLLVCAGQQVANERRGEAIHQRHQTVSALVVILVGDVPTALMIARVARAASAPSCPRRSSSRAPAPRRPREPAVRAGASPPGGQARSTGDPAPATGDIDADRRDRGVGRRGAGLAPSSGCRCGRSGLS